LDGLDGTGAIIADVDGLFFVMRGTDDAVVDHPTIQARLHVPPDASFSRPERFLVRPLSDCPDVPVGADRQRFHLVVATQQIRMEEAAQWGRTRRSNRRTVLDLTASGGFSRC
jgi:hypothetical protein